MQTFDNRRAMLEGWAICQTTGTNDDGDWRIERIDHSRIFLSDNDVWTHVINQAVFVHDLYHLSALKFIEVNNWTEFERIEAHAAYLGISNGVSQFFHLLKKGKAA